MERTMTRRLFIFAAYDKDGRADEMLLHYLHALSELGDIVFHMDNEIPEYQLDKIKQIPNVLLALAERHGEYDFGSYKRGYIWAAKEAKNLGKYDWVYLVNDSVYGPLKPLAPILEELESRGADAVGMVKYDCGDEWDAHLQSWFVGLSQNTAKGEYMDKFFNEVRRRRGKKEIIAFYEVGLSRQIITCRGKISALVDNPMLNWKMTRKALSDGIPFIKKSTTKRVSMRKIRKFVPDEIVATLVCHANRARRYISNWELRLFSIPLAKIKTSSDGKRVKFILFGFLPVVTIEKRGWHGNPEVPVQMRDDTFLVR
jgi:lipopolysaccharide biosynthesis protein